MASRGKQNAAGWAAKCWLSCGLIAVASAGPLACKSTGSDPENEITLIHPDSNPARAEFSGQKAWKYMRALNQIGARVAGTEGSERSRTYLTRALEKLDIRTYETTSQVTDGAGNAIELAHLTAEIPGRSRDVLLLAAHYDTSPADAEAPQRIDQNASGPALLLELARTLRTRSVPEYTVWLTWIDGDALEAPADGTAGRTTVHLGTQSLIDEWSREGELSRIRAAIFFGNIGERDRPILRDIDSPRIYREIFWEVAHDLGFEKVFPADSQYGVTNTGRATLAQVQLRSAVALQNSGERAAQIPTDTRTETAETKLRRPSAGFEAVGKVTLEVLVRTASKLRKIDRFAEAPLKAGREDSAPFSHAQ